MKIVQIFNTSTSFKSIDGRLTIMSRGFIIISEKKLVVRPGKVTFPNGNSHVFKGKALFSHQILLDSIYEPI